MGHLALLCENVEVAVNKELIYRYPQRRRVVKDGNSGKLTVSAGPFLYSNSFRQKDMSLADQNLGEALPACR